MRLLLYITLAIAISGCSGSNLKKELVSQSWWLKKESIYCRESCCNGYSVNHDTLSFINSAAYDSQLPSPLIELKLQKNGNYLVKTELSDCKSEVKSDSTGKWKLLDKVKMIEIQKGDKTIEYIIHGYDILNLTLIKY